MTPSTRSVFGVLVLTLSIVCFACSTISEKYHFSVRNERGQRNYFKTSINGWTLFSASQYASGLYDAEAVDALFGELQGKKVGVEGVTFHKEQPPPGPGETEPEPENPEPATVETLDGDDVTDKKLVIFLSTNSDFFVGQIESFVRSQNIQQAVASLILREDIDKLNEARGRKEIDDQRSADLAARLEDLAKRLEASREDGTAEMSVQDARAEMARLLRALALDSRTPDGGATIEDCQTARAWLSQHGSAFVPGGDR